MKSFFITGTGTGIGKTLFTGLFARFALKAGLRVAVVKPVQTGMLRVEDGDLGEIRRLAPGVEKLPDELACPYLLKLEASPHLAAEAEGVEIKIERIVETVEKAKRLCKPDLLLMEGAGGVCVPLRRDLMTTLLIKALGAPAIVVALAGLGSVNHTALTVKELRSEAVEVAGIAINRLPRDPGPVDRDNLRAIPESAKARVLAVIRENPDLSGSGFDECAGLSRLLQI